MQKLFVFVVLSALALGCSNVEKYRETITLLGSDWDNMTQQVAGFTDELAKEASTWQSMYNGMYAKVNVSQEISEDVKTEMENLNKTGQEHSATYQRMQEEISNFAKTWEEKTADVTALKEGLESGKLAPELIEKMGVLRESLDSTVPTLDEWKKNLQATKENSLATYQRYAELVKGQVN